MLNSLKRNTQCLQHKYQIDPGTSQEHNSSEKGVRKIMDSLGCSPHLLGISDIYQTIQILVKLQSRIMILQVDVK